MDLIGAYRDLYTSPYKCSSDATLTKRSTECESPLRTSVCNPTFASVSHSFSNCLIAFALSVFNQNSIPHQIPSPHSPVFAKR